MADPTAGPFTVLQSKELHVTYRGQTLIEKESLAGLDSMDAAESLDVRQEGDITVLNVIRQNDAALNFRKEIALHKNGTVELTVKANYESYTNTLRGYSFSIPLSLVKGATFKALVGRSYNTSLHEGRITADMPDGSITGGGQNTYVRFIAFQNEALRIVFDLNPYGPVQTYADYAFCGEPLSAGSVVKSGDALVFHVFSGVREIGGLYTHKILIYEGEFDYDAKHPYRRWYFRGDPTPVAHFVFGTPAAPAGTTAAGAQIYSATGKYGWAQPAQSLRMVSTNPKNVFANCVVSPDGSENAFIADVKPGYYFITLQLGHPNQDVGPFNVLVNDKRVAEHVTVSAGEIRTIITPGYVRGQEKQLRIGFHSDKSWAVSGIVLQLLITPNEDYVFDRKMWVAEGLWEPDFHVK